MAHPVLSTPSLQMLARRPQLPGCHVSAALLFALIAFLRTVPSWVDTETPMEKALTSSFELQAVPGTVRWIDRPEGNFRDAANWHELVFLGVSKPGAPADLYRVSARSTQGDSLFAVRGLRNLSASPDSDETPPSVAAPFAVIASKTQGEDIPTLTIFDFRGAQASEDPPSRGARLRNRITHYIETGRFEGVAKTTLRFTAAPRKIDYHIETGFLQLSWRNPKGESETARVSLYDTPPSDKRFALLPYIPPVKAPVLWAVDTVRSLPAVGPGPIEWLEGRTFALKDLARRTRYRLFGDEEASEDSEKEISVYADLNLPAGLEIGTPVESEVWPPPPFAPPVFTRRISGEGTWRPFTPEFVRRTPGAPPAFYESVVRPDRERPYVKVKLIAMDMRQLELHMVGGIEDPRSTTGSAGDGRIPRVKSLMERTVAAFNGAFKTEHGAYGMMVARNVLLPPKDEAATAASLIDGTALMGTWPAGVKVPATVDSYRQNMDPLVENGVVNPRRRYLWGFTLDSDITKMQTVRSGLCLSDKGYMVYVWGDDVTAQTLGTAMNAAGCTYGLHLDMNPYHTAFMFYRFELEEDDARPKYEYKSAVPETMYSPHRYVNGAPKDFFYLALRDVSPGDGWTAEGYAQPRPAFLPAVFHKEDGAVRSVAVHLSRTSAGRITEKVLEEETDEEEADEGVSKNLLVDIDLGPRFGPDVLQAQIRKALLTVDDTGTPSIDMTPTAATFEKGLPGMAFGGNAATTEIVGTGIRDRWMFIVTGPSGAVEKRLKEEGATERMFFPVEAGASAAAHVFVRSAQGLEDLNGRRVLRADLRTNHFQLSAAPKPMGARRLETAFPSARLAGTAKDKKDVSNAD